ARGSSCPLGAETPAPAETSTIPAYGKEKSRGWGRSRLPDPTRLRKDARHLHRNRRFGRSPAPPNRRASGGAGGLGCRHPDVPSATNAQASPLTCYRRWRASMAEFSRPAKVGVMTAVLLGALYGGYRFVSREAGTEGGYRVHAYLRDVTGIPPRSRVNISGIQVGVIDKISLEHGRVRVDIKMSPDTPLYDDAAIGKRSTSLIGENLIVLTPGTEGRHQIPDNGEIVHFIEEPTIESLEG